MKYLLVIHVIAIVFNLFIFYSTSPIFFEFVDEYRKINIISIIMIIFEIIAMILLIIYKKNL